MNEIVNADYKVVLERTLPVIILEILTIEKNVCSVALDGAIQIGQRLHEAKAQVEHGEWENWCKQNLNYSHSQATRFMKLATEYGDENSPDPAKAKLAVLGSQLQSIFAECMTIIGNMTGEEYTKGVNGMRMIVNNMKTKLE